MKFCCACFTDKNLHHHHLIPRSKGGTDDQTNLITLCGSCHAKIHNFSNKWAETRKGNWGWGADHKELQKNGIQNALARGVVFGKKPKVSKEQTQSMRDKREKGVLIRELMAEFNLSKASVYRLLDHDNKS